MEDGHDGALRPCSSSERDGAIGLANLGGCTQTWGDGHSDNWTAVSSVEEGLTKGASQKWRNPEDSNSFRWYEMKQVLTHNFFCGLLLLSVHYKSLSWYGCLDGWNCNDVARILALCMHQRLACGTFSRYIYILFGNHASAFISR